MGKVGVQGVGSPGGRFTGVEGDQRRERSSGLGERVGGIDERKCSGEGGSRRRSLLPSKRPTKGGPCS